MVPLAALRRDLVVSQQSGEAGVIYVIKDPVARRFFRFGEAEHFVASQLDGRTDVEAIEQRAERELGVAIDADTVRQFIDQLQRIGLLETRDRPTIDRCHHGRVSHTNPLYIRLKAFDPDRLFDRLIGKVSFFFTPWFVASAVAILITAAVITIADWNEIVWGFGRLYRFDALLLAWITVLTVTTAHEFAHGLTCKHFGGHVHEIGFLLLFFQPAFYCNVSDAWLFAEKSKRLWVMFAGAFLEISVWAVATIVWRLTDVDTTLNFVAMIVMATSGVKTLFNFNPLIKLDGYYLLSDYLEVPNLRQRSIGHLKATVKRFFGPIVDPGGDVTPRLRRIYLIYGSLATVYSVWLLSLVAIRFGGFMVERYQGPGFLAFSGLLTVVFQNPLRNAYRRLPTFRSNPTGSTAMKRRTIRVAALLVISAALFIGRMPLKVSGEFKVLPERNSDVRAPVDGLIEEVYADEGDRVRAGDVLLRLVERDYRSELAKVDAQILELRAQLKLLQIGPRPEEIQVARDELQTAKTRQEHAAERYEEAGRIHATRVTKSKASVETAENRLRYARNDLTRFKQLFETGLASKKQFEEAEEQVVMREKELELAEAELLSISADAQSDIRQDVAVAARQIQEASARVKVLLAGSRPETIEAMEAQLARMEAEQNFLTEQLRLTRIVSPATGVIATPKFKDKIGQHVAKGDLIAKVYELDTVTPEIAVSEKEIGDVRLGQVVTLRARAYPERTLTGHVKAIAPAGIEEEGVERRVFKVKVQLDNAGDLLKPEMTGNAKIVCDSRSLFNLFTRRLARYLRVEFWSWW